MGGVTKALMAPMTHCRVTATATSGQDGPVIDDHVVAVAGHGTGRRWLLAADVVHLPGGTPLHLDDVFAELPGCLVVTDLGRSPAVRVRGHGTVDVATPELAWLFGSVAHAWLAERGGGDLASLVGSARVTLVDRREGTPGVAASLLSAGRRSRFVWTEPG